MTISGITFGHGGGEDLAKRLEVPLLGQIPLIQNYGKVLILKPLVATNPDSEAGKIFAEIAETIDVELLQKDDITKDLSYFNNRGHLNDNPYRRW